MVGKAIPLIVVSEIILLGVCLQAMALEPSDARALPRIFCPEPMQDIGEVDANASATVHFVLVNTGQDMLMIGQVSTGCGCTVARIAAPNLAPGAETQLEATMSFRNRQGLQEVHIAVESNDPEHPVYTLQIRGKVAPAVTVTPPRVDFGEILDDQAHTIPVVLQSRVSDETCRIRSVEIGCSLFRAGVKEVQAGKEYEIAVSTQALLPLGNHYGVMNVFTDHPFYPRIQVNMQARCIGDLRVEPATIKLPNNPGSEIKSNQFLRVSAGRIRNFRLLQAVVPVPTMRAEIDERGVNHYLIKLLDMPADGSLEGKSLVLKTDNPDKPEISIPFEHSALKSGASR